MQRSVPSFPGSEPRYFNANIVSLYIDANLARFAAWVRVALKMRVAFSFKLSQYKCWPQRNRNGEHVRSRTEEKHHASSSQLSISIL